MENKPNIIYIFSDQHRGDSMGCVGHPAVITPNMDRLASQGVTFTKCCTNSPLCMPARASMMTGKYVGEHGVWTNDLEAPSSSQSHVRNIRDAGYHTAVIGKTHLYTHGVNHWSHTQDQEHILKDWGFEYIHELTGPIATFWHGSPYTDYLKENGLLEKHKEYMGNYIKQWSKGTTRSWDLPPPPLPPEMHLDSYTGQKAVEWIDAHDGNKPFYLQIMFPGPHDPFDSPQHYRDMYHIDSLPKGILEFPKKPIPLHIKMLLAWSGLKDMSPEDCQRLRLNYYAKITLIDEYIGKILDAVEKKGLSNNIWIIYNSDHGELLGDHMMRHKIAFYEGAFKIPLIVKPPGNYSGWQSKALTDHIDIAATLIDVAGAKPLKGSDGSLFLQKILNKLFWKDI